MKIKHDKTLIVPEKPTSLSRIEQCAWSQNGDRLAVCLSNSNQVTLYSGGNLDKKEKFALKPVDKAFSKTSFTVKGLAFSPDSTKIAVGQTDSVIYIFKVGLEVGEKKVISGKYSISSSCTCLFWHEKGIVFGSLDGKVKLIQTSSNRMANVVSSNSMVISMAVSGDDVCVGFLSGAIVLTSLGSKESSRQVASSTCPAFALTMTSKSYVCFGGCDGKLTFVNTSISVNDSRARQVLELGVEINIASSSPSGNLIVIACNESLILFKFENYWRKGQTINLTGGHLITCISWTKDGTRMCVATVNGGVELFSFEWKKKMIGDKFQVDFVGGNQVVISDISTKVKALFKSEHEIEDVKIIRDNYAVVKTSATLIVGDILENSPEKTSEVEWTGMSMKGTRFSFDYEGVVLINVVGELYVIELGQNDFLCSVRTDFVNPHLMSVRINERKSGVKVIAYLFDLKTVCVLDLVTNFQMCVWNHGKRIDWIELNETGKKMLFRDRSQRLHIIDILTQESQVILNFCGFVQWVPGSDVIVAQSQEKVYIWYDLAKPVVQEIAGGTKVEVTGIERANGITKIVFSNKTELQLDESLIEFDTALQDGDLDRAVSFLESMKRTLTTESESMWRQLGKIALKNHNLLVAERAYAAVGDIPKATFIKECQGDIHQLALLEGDWNTFEMNDFEEAIEMYLKLNKWQRAIDLAARTGRNDVQEDLEQRYFNHLMESGQEAEAASVKEKSGDVIEAIKLYQSSGRAVQAANVILKAINGRHASEMISDSLINSVIADLKASDFYAEAGGLYEMALNDPSSALEAYVSGKDFVKAIDLSRREFQDEVVSLEGKYGEYLLTELNDPASAISHLIEAGKTERALEAAIKAGQFDRASQISMVLEKVPAHHARQIADYYASREDIDSAIELFMNSGLSREAINLLNSKGNYNRSFKLAKKIMSEDEVVELFGNLATSCRNEGKVKEAEKIFLTVRDTDSAISMYKELEDYDNMIRLVQQYHPDLLKDTHLHLGSLFEKKGKFKEAESHYLSGHEWSRVIEMYKNQEMFEDAYRVARNHAGPLVSREVAFLWSSQVSPTERVKLLTRIGLLNQVIDYAIEAKQFDFALSLVSNAGSELKFKVNEIKYKNALFFEDEGRLSDAEVLFLESGKVKEAVRMYVRAKSFPDALRVADQHLKDDETVISDVLVAQAKYITEVEGKNPESLARVEALLLRAGRMEVMVRMYREEKMFEEAFRVAEQYAPNLVDSLKREMSSRPSSGFSFMDGMTPVASRRPSRAAMSRSRQDDTRRSSVLSLNNDDDSLLEDARDLRQNLERAEKSGDREKVVKLAFTLASQLTKERDPVQALKVLSTHTGVFLLQDINRVVTRISEDLFSFEYQQNPGISVFKSLRDSLFSVINHQPVLEENDSKESKFLLISHFMVLKEALSKVKDSHPLSIELLMKISISLLRYTDVVRVDKSFYEAGLICKAANKCDMAFIFWNHFLDLVEAIEDGKTDVDHSSLESTDIPSAVPLPDRLFHDPSVVDDVKSWILEVSMDTQDSRSLPLCTFRDGDAFEGSLVCGGSVSMPCIVTGYPVIKHKMMQLKPGKYASNKDDWNKLVMLTKMSASEDLKEVLMFIGRLCGNASVARFSFQ